MALSTPPEMVFFATWLLPSLFISFELRTRSASFPATVSRA